METVSANGETMAYAYDNVGNQESVSGSVISSAFEYDSMNLPMLMTNTAG